MPIPSGDAPQVVVKISCAGVKGFRADVAVRPALMSGRCGQSRRSRDDDTSIHAASRVGSLTSVHCTRRATLGCKPYQKNQAAIVMWTHSCCPQAVESGRSGSCLRM